MSYLALVAVDQEGIIRFVHHHAQRKRDTAVCDCDEGALVWLDGDLEVLDAVFLDKGFVTFGIWSRNKRAEKNIIRTRVRVGKRCNRSGHIQYRLQAQCLQVGEVLCLWECAAVHAVHDATKILWRHESSSKNIQFILRSVKLEYRRL